MDMARRLGFGWKIGVECGQRWYRPRSWRPYTLGRDKETGKLVKIFTFFRRWKTRRGTEGFAVGPLMFWRGGTE